MTTITSASHGTIEHIDPNSVVLETNVRTAVALDPEFVASIRSNGVLVPAFGWRDADGNVHVRAGQRRTLAAREAGIPTMPVYVIGGADEDTARRVIEQLVENEHREALTDAERVEAWKQLELEGLSVTQIAKRTGTKRDRIKTGLTVAASETGTLLVAGAGLTLDQAAELIEFEDDPETVANLTEIAGTNPDYFPVAVQRARNNRAATALREKIEAEHAAKGHRILDDWPSHEIYSLRKVSTADGEPVTEEDVDGKPGIAVYVDVWNAKSYQVLYYVDDLEAAGLVLRPEADTGPRKGPMTDEQKAERRTLIANNKEWDAAETVRREWVGNLLRRKTLPKDAASITATLMTVARHEIGDAISHGNHLAATLLGLEGIDTYYENRLATYLTDHPTKAAQVTLAIALGGVEHSTDRNTWRSPNPRAAAYLQALNAWGYPLTPVEKIAAMLNTEPEAATEPDTTTESQN